MKLRVIRRYLLSILWFIILFIRNIFTKKRHYFSRFAKKGLSEVHISCPGPSAKMIEAYCFEGGAPVIFVNHAVSLVDSPAFLNTRNFFFSADAVRVAEVINAKRGNLSKCTSILVPGHLFQVSRKILKSIDHISIPKCSFSVNYGLVIQERDISDIQALSDRPVCYGFGSLLMSISFALAFKPKVIHVWGADLKSVNGATYFSNDVPKIEPLPFELMRNAITIAANQLHSQGVEMRIHRGNQDE